MLRNIMELYEKPDRARMDALAALDDLKQINSLLASAAYPVLEEHGLLRGSRLRTIETGIISPAAGL